MVILSYPYFIEIPKPCQECSKGSEPLAGKEYYSALFENEEQSHLERKDFCSACWKAFISESAFSKVKSYWKSRMPEKNLAIKPPKSKQEAVFASLADLLKQDTDEARRLSYMLTLFLARQKLLALRQEVELEGVKCGLFEILHLNEMICVKKVPLSELGDPELQIKAAALLAYKPEK